MPDVFISYRRIDQDFVHRLDDALRERGKDVWVDWEDIPPGSVDFTQDLLRGIESSDALLSVLSPDYLVSEYCLGELEYAYQNNKKLIPVVYRAIDDDQLPSSIRHINQIFFNRDADFDAALDKVIEALENDWPYHQEHSRLLMRAHEWERAEHDTSFLLRGVDLAHAEQWLVESAHKEPGATDLQTEYILASRQASIRRQRAIVGSLVVGLVIAMTLAIVALIGFQRAEQNLEQALITQSLFLADLSRQQLDREHFRVALLLALESLSNYPRVFNSESSKALLNALNTPPQKLLALPHPDPISSLQWSEDATRTLSTAGNAAYVADTVSGDIVLTLTHSAPVRGAIWNADQRQILTWSDDNTARVWDAMIATELFPPLRHLGPVQGAVWNRDESRILTWSNDGTARIWDADGRAITSLIHEDAVSWAQWNQDESQVLTLSADGTAYLWAIDSTLLATYPHAAALRGAAWNAAENLLLLWSVDGAVRVWASDGTLIADLSTTRDVQGARWNPGDTRIVTWSLSGTVQVWDWAANTLLHTMRHNTAVNGAIWNKQGDRILSWSRDGTVRVWDAASGTQLYTLSHSSAVNGARWNSDESRLVTWSADATARIWDAADGNEERRLTHETGVVRAQWNETQELILTATADNRLHLWTTLTNDANPRQPVFDLNPDSRATGLTWDTARERFLMWLDDGRVEVRAGDNGTLLLTVRHDSAVNGAAWSRDESRILSWGADNSIRIWDTASGDLLRRFNTTGPVRGAAWNTDEDRVLSWSGDGVVSVWHVNDDAEPAALRHSGTVRGALWDASGRRILTWTNNDAVQVWDAIQGQVAYNLPHDRGRLSFNVQGAAWNRDGTRVLSWAQDGGVRVWVIAPDAPADTVLAPALTLQHNTVVRSALWNPDETRIMTWTGKGDDLLRVWDASDGTLVLPLPHGASSFGISGAVWNRDGSRILSWSSNGLVRVWDALARSAGESLMLAIPHNRNVQGANWSADETRLLTWPTDLVVQMWDATTGKELLLLTNNDVAQSAAWSADERRIVLRIRGGLVRMWVVDVEELIAIGSGRVIDSLSNAERERFFLPPLPPTPAHTITTTPTAAY